ncbi:NADH-ubiquinone oxidoreductase-F iron-sulfur binding region domain-containing protein [Pilimelia columellifera]|uniref:NADH-quinone oxidoreductase subunit NuoF family protein n=1 Tax=Pilimelia columellifera subsp. columellifera TaxID=706583 RepID=A0ABN3NN15_9ACTN
MTSPVPFVVSIGTPRLTAGFDEHRRLNLWAHEDVHGGLPELSGDEVLALVEEISLKGRGGAGFPFARKIKAVVEAAESRKLPVVVVVNATEGEPAAWKDKTLLTRAPHLILDGATLAAEALAAEEIVIGIGDDGVGEKSITAALAERQMPAPTRIVAVPHRFISGEGGALVNGINGQANIPPGIKKRSSDEGVDGLPTLLSNAETFAQLAIAARTGAAHYGSVGTAAEPGTVMLTVSGSAQRPAVVECATGTPLKEVLRLCGAEGSAGVLTGGFHGKWITAEAAARAEVSRAGFAEVGGALGAGIIIPLGDTTCPIGEVARVVQYLAGESAGQCGPCRFGLPDIARLVREVAAGTGAVSAVRAAVGVVKGRGACSHPDGTAAFTLSAIEIFADDIAEHARNGSCGRPIQDTLPMPRKANEEALQLSVDWSRCDGHGLCAYVAPELIRLDGNGFPAFPDLPVPPWLESDAKQAVKVCPELALRLGRGGPPPTPPPRRR